MKIPAIIIAVLVIAISSALTQQKAATLSKEEATRIALKKFPGGIVKSAELETEEGKQVWSFDIEVDKKIHEIWIDATSGEIVKTEPESQTTEATEKGMDRAEKIALREIPGEVINRGSATVRKQPAFRFLIKSKHGPEMAVYVNKKTYKVVRVTPAELEARPADSTKK